MQYIVAYSVLMFLHFSIALTPAGTPLTVIIYCLYYEHTMDLGRKDLTFVFFMYFNSIHHVLGM